jgi:hypothetical protein
MSHCSQLDKPSNLNIKIVENKTKFPSYYPFQVQATQIKFSQTILKFPQHIRSGATETKLKDFCHVSQKAISLLDDSPRSKIYDFN